MIDEVVTKVLGGATVRAAVQQVSAGAGRMTLGDFARMGGASVGARAAQVRLGPGAGAPSAGFGAAAKFSAMMQAGARAVGAPDAAPPGETERVLFMAVMVAALDRARGQSVFSLDLALSEVTGQLDGLRQGRGDMNALAAEAAGGGEASSALKSAAASMNSAALAAIKAVK